MKIAVCQSRPYGGDPEGALALVDRMLTAAAAAGAEMAVFPELFLPGYNRPDLHATLAQEQGGAWERQLSGICRGTGCGLAIGWAERDGAAVYNAASCHDRTGRKLAHFRKIQLFGPMERASFLPGDAYVTFPLGDLTAGLLICYDVEFAHHVQALARRGVSLLLVPTANPEGYENVPDILVPARAAETGMTVAYANYHGAEGALRFGGRSLVAGPDGAVLAKAGTGEALLIVEIGGADAAAALSTQLADRRTLE